ncbi:MAG: hypothetical protein Q8T09_12310 [Candidatus Melainabacteria bacterium]|nr:hypothetical protein [Candidatus Melainabacteria bacterium]
MAVLNSFNVSLTQLSTSSQLGRLSRLALKSAATLTVAYCLVSFIDVSLGQNSAMADNSPALTKSVSGKYDARVVMIYDHECAVWCGQVKPILSELQNEYKSRVQFVELDTSNDQMASSKNTAKSIGVSKFLNENADYAPVIGVFSAKGKLLKELVGPKKKEIYTDAISKALSP